MTLSPPPSSCSLTEWPGDCLRSALGEASPLARAEASLVAVLTALGRKRRLARLLGVQGYSIGNPFEQKRVDVYLNLTCETLHSLLPNKSPFLKNEYQKKWMHLQICQS